MPRLMLKLPCTGTEPPGAWELLVAAMSLRLSLRRPFNRLECCNGPEPSLLAWPVVLADWPMLIIYWRDAHEVEL